MIPEPECLDFPRAVASLLTNKYSKSTQMLTIGPEKLRNLLPLLDSPRFSRDIFEKTGLFIIRNAIPKNTLDEWLEAWSHFYSNDLGADRSVNRFNPVSVDQVPPAPLCDIYKHPSILDIIEQAFGPNIALYNQRFVIKDHKSRDQVFLHQDSPYHFGNLRKASAFLALSPMNKENGGMFFYPGSNQLGYLGDAGEINPEILPPDWPIVCPELNPGDIALMNSLTWHGSGPHVAGPDRVLADIIYQPADDPTGSELLRGEWQTEVFLSKEARMQTFKRSRSTRLKEMQARLDLLEKGQF